MRAASIRSAISATSASGIRCPPSAVMTWTTGKMRRVRSGPPVAESSSAASYSAWMTAVTQPSAVEVVAVELLQRAAGEQRARADAVEGGLLVAAAGHVVAEDAALVGVEVEAGEQRDDGESLHREAEVGADQGGEPVGLAVHRERRALDLLVVLELGLEEPHHLDRETGGAGDADHGVLVGREDLLDVALGDDVAHRGAAITRHHDAAGERRGDDGGAVRREVAGVAGRYGAARRQQVGRLRRRGSR